MALGRSGPAQHPQEVGAMAARRPALLAVQHVHVPVAHGACAHSAEIGAGLGLGVTEREEGGAGPQPREEPLTLLVGAVGDDRLGDDARPERWARGAGVRHLVPQDELVHRRQPAARRPRPARPATAIRARRARGTSGGPRRRARPRGGRTRRRARARPGSRRPPGGTAPPRARAWGSWISGPHRSADFVHQWPSRRGSSYQTGSRFSANAFGPSLKSGWSQCIRSNAQAYSIAWV